MSRSGDLLKILEDAPSSGSGSKGSPVGSLKGSAPFPTTRDTIGDSTVDNIFKPNIVGDKPLIGTNDLEAICSICKKPVSLIKTNKSSANWVCPKCGVVTDIIYKK